TPARSPRPSAGTARPNGTIAIGIGSVTPCVTLTCSSARAGIAASPRAARIALLVRTARDLRRPRGRGRSPRDDGYLVMGGEGNNHIAVEQGRIGRRGQGRGPVGRVPDRLTHGFIAVAAAHLYGGDHPARHLSDTDLAADTGMSAGRANPGALDSSGNHGLILRQCAVRARYIQVLFGLQLRAQIRLALRALLLDFALLRQLLRLAVSLGLGLCLGCRLGLRLRCCLALGFSLGLALRLGLCGRFLFSLFVLKPLSFLFRSPLLGFGVDRRGGGLGRRSRWARRGLVHDGALDRQHLRRRLGRAILPPAPHQSANDRRVNQDRQDYRQDAIAAAFAHGVVGGFRGGSVWKPTLCAPACCSRTMAWTTRPQ